MSTHPMTAKILARFEQVSAIPRRSRHEEGIRAWLIEWATEHNFTTKTDTIGNLVIFVPGSHGHEKDPAVVLQGHLDMVCEKTPEKVHDFNTDPIVPKVHGDWLTADGTTLGADNGIAIAMAMEAAVHPELVHPPLELLFTIDEETGLTGALELSSDLLTGTSLINIDSEDEGVVTVGCAGGISTHSTLPITWEATTEAGYRVKIGGLTGGHSGVDIHLERGNAIKLLARTLTGLDGLRIASIQGGSAHNAIPRDAEAIVVFANEQALIDHTREAEQTYLRELKTTDPKLHIQVLPTTTPSKVLTADSTKKVLAILQVMPHGVAGMSQEMKGLVETSNNLATVSIVDDQLVILTSQRSSVVSRLQAHTQRIEAVALLAGGTSHSGEGYPPWQPDFDSTLLATTKQLYKARFKKDIVVEVIHAGLECGIIGDRYPQLEMVSIGPTIESPHCPDERLLIPTIGMVWDLLSDLLTELTDR